MCVPNPEIDCVEQTNTQPNARGKSSSLSVNDFLRSVESDYGKGVATSAGSIVSLFAVVLPGRPTHGYALSRLSTEIASTDSLDSDTEPTVQ